MRSAEKKAHTCAIPALKDVYSRTGILFEQSLHTLPHAFVCMPHSRKRNHDHDHSIHVRTSIRIYCRSTLVLQQRIELHTHYSPSRLAPPEYRTTGVALYLFNTSRTSREREGVCTTSADAVCGADTHSVSDSLQLAADLGERYGVHGGYHPLRTERVSTV